MNDNDLPGFIIKLIGCLSIAIFLPLVLFQHKSNTSCQDAITEFAMSPHATPEEKRVMEERMNEACGRTLKFK